MVTDEMVLAALRAAQGRMIDTRPFFTAEERDTVRAMLEAAAGAQSESAPRPTLPKAIGISRDTGSKAVLVSFESELTDDDVRHLHDWLNGHYPAAYGTLIESNAPRGRLTAAPLPESEQAEEAHDRR